MRDVLDNNGNVVLGITILAYKIFIYNLQSTGGKPIVFTMLQSKKKK